MLAVFVRSEASGNLTFHAPWSDVSFGLIVVEGDAFVVQEAQHREAVLLAPRGQVPARCLLRPALSPRDQSRWGIGVQTSLEQRIKAHLEVHRDLRGQRALLLLVTHRTQRVPELSRPHLTMVLGQTAQFAQQVSTTQGMLTKKLEVRSPGVVYHDALELRQDVHDFQRSEAPLRIVTVQGELRAAHPVHPLELPIHLAPGLVGMQNRLERGFQLRFEVSQTVSGQLEVQDDGTVTGTRPA